MAKGRKKMSANHKGNLNPSRPNGKAWKQHPRTLHGKCAKHGQ